MKYILYIIACLGLCWSCDMNENPKAQISIESLFGSETGLKMYTNSFYDAFPSSTVVYSASSPYTATNTQNLYLIEGAYSPEMAGGWLWTQLRNINYFIVNSQQADVSPDILNNYQGIARFFRAYFYFNMMASFGDLPWINSPMDVDDPALYAKRDPRTLIVDSIKADLDFAIGNIKELKSSGCNEITKCVAATLKSRVCLYEGTFRKYRTEAGLGSSANEWLQEAADAARFVMDAGYSLYTGSGTEKSYRQLFISKVPVSTEIICAVTYDGDLGVVHGGNRNWTSTTFSSSPCLIRSFINTYLMKDGTPFTDKENYQSMFFSEECKNRDARLSQTIRTPGFTRIDAGQEVATAPNYAYASTGYHIYKFTLDDTQYDNVDVCDNNSVVFRFAEVLLNYAEAKAEMGTLTDDEWSVTIGALRSRAGITGGLTAKPTKADPYLQKTYFPDISDPTILEIRRERWIELVLEGLEWNDICRWKVGNVCTRTWDGVYIPKLDVPYDMNEDGKPDVCFTQKLDPDKIADVYYVYVGKTLASGANSNTQLDSDGHTLLYMKDQKRTWHDKLYFNPIPANDRVLNPNLDQNPGW